jgi:hypothetical protein
MLTIQEIIEIYASENVTVTEAEAAKDLAHAMSDTPSYATLVRRINGYANQAALETNADACEAAEFETNYQ